MINLTFYCNNIISKLCKFGILSHSGRNFLGRICIKGRGAGNKKVYKFIDFFRRSNLFGKVLKIVYDSNRSAHLALILYENGLNSFIIATENLKIFDFIYSGIIFSEATSWYKGWAVPIKNIGLFTIVSNLEKKLYQGATIARAAGTSALLISKADGIVTFKLNSKWHLNLNENCIATIGAVSNKFHKYEVIGSAGKKRNLGFRPKVRGVAKNPCDHPHGGGNGKHSPPVVPLTAFGKFAKWTHTKNKLKNKLDRRFFKKI